LENKKIVIHIVFLIFVLTLSVFQTWTSSIAAITIPLGKEKKLDVELSPKIRLFNTEEDGYFYPGGRKITKNLHVINISDVPFRICRFEADFQQEIQLADALQIEILELGEGEQEANRFYLGKLMSLQEGIAVEGQRAIALGKSSTLQITIWMPHTVGNDYQGLTMAGDMIVTVRFEPKSMGRENGD